MTTTVQPQAARPGMAVWKAVLLILPIALLSSSQWLPAVLSGQAEPAQAIAFPVAYLAFFVVFVLMLTTGKTHRYRSVLFMAFAVSLPLDFIPWMIKTTGSMMLSESSIYSAGASFCPLTMPMIIIPALLKRIVIFPGELLPTAAHGAFSTMFMIWVGASLATGRGWCSWGCFYGAGTSSSLACAASR